MAHLSEKVQPIGNSVSSGTTPGMVLSRVCRNESWPSMRGIADNQALGIGV